MRRALREHTELNTDGLENFLEEELGNLPLSVKLIGHVMRAKRLHVRDIMSDFKRLRLSEVGFVRDIHSNYNHTWTAIHAYTHVYTHTH